MFEETRTERRGQDRGWTGKGTTRDNKISGKEQCYYTAQSLWKFLELSIPNQ